MMAPGNFTNRAKMVSSYFLNRSNRVIYPQEVVIELTNHCNLACSICPHPKMTRQKGFMDEALFRKIIDEISGKTEFVYLYGTGESLLHKKLPDFSRYAKSRGLTTFLSTNGLPMNEGLAERLLSCGLDHLLIALDGGVKETYENIRINGNFDKLIANIKLLLRLKAVLNSPTKICLQTILMEQNAHEMQLFEDLFTPQEKRLVSQFRLKPLYETRAFEQKPITHSKPCYWLWNMMTICWNGDVALCCTDYDATYNMGNVMRQSVQEIWNSDFLWHLRDKHRNLRYNDMKLCGTCVIPEQGYFNPVTILASIFLDAAQIRNLMPTYEKYIVLPMQSRLRKLKKTVAT